MKHQIEGLRSGLLFFIAAFLVSGCAIKTVNRDVNPDMPPTTSDIPEPATATETPKVQAPPVVLTAPVDDPSQISEPTIKLVKDPEAQLPASLKTKEPAELPTVTDVSTEVTVVPPVVTDTPVEVKPKAVPASTALGWLKNGNNRFLKGFFRKDGQSAKDIQKLTFHQSPHSIVLACGDSRMPPEIVFDQKLGEIYVIRLAQLNVDVSMVNNLEHALQNLNSHLLVVLGHNSCGAVKTVALELPQVSSMIQEKVNSGELLIKFAQYNLGNGKVDFEP